MCKKYYETEVGIAVGTQRPVPRQDLVKFPTSRLLGRVVVNLVQN